jgi:hypothetical protein
MRPRPQQAGGIQRQPATSDVTLATVINGGNGGPCVASIDGHGNLIDSEYHVVAD